MTNNATADAGHKAARTAGCDLSAEELISSLMDEIGDPDGEYLGDPPRRGRLCDEDRGFLCRAVELDMRFKSPWGAPSQQREVSDGIAMRAIRAEVTRVVLSLALELADEEPVAPKPTPARTTPRTKPAPIDDLDATDQL